MRLAILQIADRGQAFKERLHLSVLADTNLAYYAVFDTLKSGTGVVAIPKNAYWFVDKPVQAGDNVILYTCGGTNQSQPRMDGKTNYFFYWGLEKTIWNSPEAVAVLLEIAEWATSPMGTTLTSLSKPLGRI